MATDQNYDFHTIEKVKRPNLSAFRGALSIAPKAEVENNPYYQAKKGFASNMLMSANLGLVQARLVVEEFVDDDSVIALQNIVNKIIDPRDPDYDQKIRELTENTYLVPIHGLTVDPDNINIPTISDTSRNFISYALGQHLEDKTGYKFYPWLRPTNSVKRTGLNGASIFAAQSLFKPTEGHEEDLKGKNVILIDNNVYGGASFYSAATTVMRKMGAKVIGLVTLTQRVTPQHSKNQAWTFLPDEKMKKRFDAKMNFAKDTGKFKETVGYDVNHLTKKEMQELTKLLYAKQKEQKSSRWNLDAVTDDIISIREKWANQYHNNAPKVTTGVQTQPYNKAKNTSLVYNPPA